MNTVHASRYWIIEVMDLPEEVQDELECPANDAGKILNPRYHPKLNQWLKDNGHKYFTEGQPYEADVCYIGWWSW